ncbi:ELL-associated factor 1-like [Sitodiplosis mosellana]|uniref:ELL-associated factor 1-like n=1 Tax=Sitodiplosis mosellana TaxID=263140 RepID=UPI00244451D2|nr:ELL-associated factor 1-like [Sitodiplosis mosellana]
MHNSEYFAGDTTRDSIHHNTMLFTLLMLTLSMEVSLAPVCEPQSPFPAAPQTPQPQQTNGQPPNNPLLNPSPNNPNTEPQTNPANGIKLILIIFPEPPSTSECTSESNSDCGSSSTDYCSESSSSSSC